MIIWLVRHGRPTSPNRKWISGRELGRWVSAYDASGLDRNFPPPASVSRVVASAGCVLASDVRRSLESAAWLAPSAHVHADSMFREAALPQSLLPLRLPPGFCVVVSRIAWWLGWARADEDLPMTRQRAARAADRLCELAEQHQSVAVVGHGMFNRFLARQLTTRGWRGPAFLPSAHWSCAAFASQS